MAAQLAQSHHILPPLIKMTRMQATVEESGTVNSSILTMDCTDPEVDNKSRSFQVGNKRVKKRDQKGQ